MTQVQQTFEITNVESLDKFLKGVLQGIRRKEVSIEEADAISKVADKVIKNNITRIMYKKMTNSDAPLPDFEPIANQNLIQKTA